MLLTITFITAAFLLGLIIGTSKAPSFKAEYDGLYMYYNSAGPGSSRDKTLITTIIKS